MKIILKWSWSSNLYRAVAYDGDNLVDVVRAVEVRREDSTGAVYYQPIARTDAVALWDALFALVMHAAHPEVHGALPQPRKE